MSDGRNILIVSALTQKEAAKLMGVSLHAFRQYASVTANVVQCGVALNQPGTVFFQPHNNVLEPFRPRVTHAATPVELRTKEEQQDI